MPCSCGHITCLCVVPCLCEASACKCLDCAAAIGKVCKMCNKAFYYEYLVLKRTREEDVCNCFMVKSEVQDKKSTISPFETCGTHSHVVPHILNNFNYQNIEQMVLNYPPHIHGLFGFQCNYPSGNENFGTADFNPSGQSHTFSAEQGNVQGINPEIDYSGNNIHGQPELYNTENIQESGNIQSNGPTNSFAYQAPDSANRVPEQTERNGGHTSDFAEQSGIAGNTPPQWKRLFYKIPGETDPVFINLQSDAVNSTITECRDATLKWLRNVPGLELPIYSKELINKKVE